MVRFLVALLALIAVSNAFGSEPLDQILGPVPRILIFSPHPDDDVLGAASLIKSVTTMKIHGIPAEVHVVFMTCGDGYKEALDHLETLGLAKTYIDLGKIRHLEALAGESDVGVSPDLITFLGFPDQGMDPIYTATSSKPYFSDYTQTAQVPYDFAFHPGEPYTRDTVVKDIVELIDQFKPTIVFTPTLTDNHPDHAATRKFVTMALEQMHSDIVHMEFLIHWELQDGSWPGDNLDWQVPPGHIPADYSFELESHGMTHEQKIQAIDRHFSQVEIEGEYLRGFAKNTEQFWNTHASLSDYLKN